VVVVVVVLVVVVVRAVYYAVVQDISSQNLKDTLVRMDLCLSRGGGSGYMVQCFQGAFLSAKPLAAKVSPQVAGEINQTLEWWRDIR
jgi:hypothetical protein